MPCRVSSDAHEWNNEGPTVPAWYPVNPRKVDEQSTDSQREKKTPWSFTAACRWDMAVDAERRREPLYPSLSGDWGRQQWNTPRKNIKGAQRSAQEGQKPSAECKGKSWPDWILHSKGSRGESLA